MGYTVRSGKGYRLTEYVPYDNKLFRGDWTRPGDIELYDYNIDPHETKNWASDVSHKGIVTALRAVLRSQFDPTARK